MPPTLERLVRADEMREIVSLGLVEARALAVSDPAALDEALAACVASLRERFEGKTAGQLPHLRPARDLYRSIGIEPTRYRPSPEALTRRILRGDDFPRIHPAVDLANLWAVESGLPVGLYDVERIAAGPIELRLGREGESYEGIRKGELRAEGRLVLVDGEGPFGNPSADSLRTSVHEGTRDCLFVMFAPTSVDAGSLDRWAAWLRVRAEALLGAETFTAVLP